MIATRARRAGRAAVRVALFSALLAGLAAIGSLASVQPTRAAWSDSARATADVTAMTVPGVAASTLRCVDGSDNRSLTLSWPATDARVDYRVVARQGNGSLYFTTIVRSTGTTASVVVPRRTDSSWGTFEHSVTITPLLVGTDWTAASTTRSIWEQGSAGDLWRNYVYCARP